MKKIDELAIGRFVRTFPGVLYIEIVSQGILVTQKNLN